MEIRRSKVRWKVSLPCRSCQRDTSHSMQYALAYREYTEERDVADGGPFPLCDNWAIWKCDGCGMLTLVESASDPEEFQKGELGDDYLNWATFYPKEMRIQPKQFSGIPVKLQRIYAETVEAFNDELGILCAIGLRSIIEGLCDDKEISSNRDNLEKKLTSLTKLGIPANIVDNLHAFRFMGNTAVHELVAPSQEDLRLAIEIMEDLLNFVYALNYKTNYFRNRQKPRIRFVVSKDTGNSDQSQ